MIPRGVDLTHLWSASGPGQLPRCDPTARMTRDGLLRPPFAGDPRFPSQVPPM